MRRSILVAVGVFIMSLLFSPLVSAGQSPMCPPDAVKVGPMCVDKYEASVWETKDAKLITGIQEGKITKAADLTGKATQHGAEKDDYGEGCPDTGNGCKDFYAVSIPGVIPSRYITWFQA